MANCGPRPPQPLRSPRPPPARHPPHPVIRLLASNNDGVMHFSASLAFKLISICFCCLSIFPFLFRPPRPPRIPVPWSLFPVATPPPLYALLFQCCQKSLLSLLPLLLCWRCCLCFYFLPVSPCPTPPSLPLPLVLARSSSSAASSLAFCFQFVARIERENNLSG